MKKILLVLIPALLLLSTSFAEARSFSSSRGGSSFSSRGSSFGGSSFSKPSTSYSNRSFSSSKGQTTNTSYTNTAAKQTANRLFSTNSNTTRSQVFSNGGWGNRVFNYNSYNNGGGFFHGYMMGSMFNTPYYGGGYYGTSPYFGMPSYGYGLGYASNVGGFGGGILFLFIRAVKIFGAIRLGRLARISFEEDKKLKGALCIIILLLLLTI